MGFKKILKYDFLEGMKVGDVEEWPEVRDRGSIRTIALDEERYGYGISIKQRLNDEGKRVLRVERTK